MKRLVIFLLSLLIASYLIFVFMTIKSPEGSDTMCKGVKIEIAQDENEGFLTVSEEDAHGRPSESYRTDDGRSQYPPY